MLRARLEPRCVYNAVVWTESALDFCRRSPGFYDVMRNFHERTQVQIILAPGASSSEQVYSDFEDFRRKLIVLARDTSVATGHGPGLSNYCVRTFEAGVASIRQFANGRSARALVGTLGALIPAIDVSFEEAQAAKPEDKLGVIWRAVQAGESIFLGPALPHLAELLLVHHGVDPERALWLCHLPREAGKKMVDFAVAFRAVRSPGASLPVHVGEAPIPTPEVSDWPFQQCQIEVAGRDREDQLRELSTALTAIPIHLHHNCDLLRSREIFRPLANIRPAGEKNKGLATHLLSEWY